ncbi:hypothetical protein VPH35_085929 [Triticum aestivum]
MEEAVGHDGVGAVVGEEPVERLPEQSRRVEELVAVVLGRERRAVLDARREPDVGERHDGDVDGRAAGAGEGVVGAVDGGADDGGVDGRGEDGALHAAAGEERGHVSDRDEVAGRQERKEEDVQRLLPDSHGWRASRDRGRRGGGDRSSRNADQTQASVRLRREACRGVFIKSYVDAWALVF